MQKKCINYLLLSYFQRADFTRRYHKILKLSPYHVDTLTAYATMLWNSGKPHQAKDMFEKALRIDPLHLSALINLGMALLSEGLPLAALALFERAIAADPSSADAQLGFAIANEDAGSIPGADLDAAYQAALRLCPLSAPALYSYGRFLKAKRDDPDGAERCYRTALDINPDDVNVLLSYATLLAEAAEFPRAEECYKRALRAQPLNPHTLYGYAMLLCRWERVFTRRPDDPVRAARARTPRLAAADVCFRKVGLAIVAAATVFSRGSHTHARAPAHWKPY